MPAPLDAALPGEERFKINYAHQLVGVLSPSRRPRARGFFNIGGQRLGLTGGFCFVLLCFACFAFLCLALLCLRWVGERIERSPQRVVSWRAD